MSEELDAVFEGWKRNGSSVSELLAVTQPEPEPLPELPNSDMLAYWQERSGLFA